MRPPKNSMMGREIDNRTAESQWNMLNKIRGCTCKVGYATVEIASKQAYALNHSYNGKQAIRNGKPPAEAYSCRHCRLFHVGHSSLPAKKEESK